MNYRKLLDDSLAAARRHDLHKTRQELLADVFGFTTYDDEMDTLFVSKALEVCRAITDKQTFDYIKDESNYVWYLSLLNMPFFSSKVDWGGSIRGAWWNHGEIALEGICWGWLGDEQLSRLEFDADGWGAFLEAIHAFAEGA